MVIRVCVFGALYGCNHSGHHFQALSKKIRVSGTSDAAKDRGVLVSKYQLKAFVFWLVCLFYPASLVFIVFGLFCELCFRQSRISVCFRRARASGGSLASRLAVSTALSGQMHVNLFHPRDSLLCLRSQFRPADRVGSIGSSSRGS